MGGSIESWFESWGPKLLAKIPYCSELGNKTGMTLATSHCFFHAWFGLQFCLLALVTSKWVASGSVVAWVLVWVAEKNERKERKADWITRSFGWFLGAVPGVLILIWG